MAGSAIFNIAADDYRVHNMVDFITDAGIYWILLFAWLYVYFYLSMHHNWYSAKRIRLK